MKHLAITLAAVSLLTGCQEKIEVQAFDIYSNALFQNETNSNLAVRINDKTVEISPGTNAYLSEEGTTESTEISIAQQISGEWSVALKMKQKFRNDRIESFQVRRDESGRIKLFREQKVQPDDTANASNAASVNLNQSARIR